MEFHQQIPTDRQTGDGTASSSTIKLPVRTKEKIFRLLGLPLKIRLAILAHVVAHPFPVPVGRHTFRLPSSRHSITLVNKQLRKEALAVYHTCNRFSVALISYDIKPALPALQQWMANYCLDLATRFGLRVDGAWRVFVDGEVDWMCVREWIKLARQDSIPLLLPTRGTSTSEHDSVGVLIDLVSGAQSASDEETEELLCAYRRIVVSGGLGRRPAGGGDGGDGRRVKEVG